ncbi:hypothetical protein HDU67_002027, partial [Dinochytrium kinnereticum]
MTPSSASPPGGVGGRDGEKVMEGLPKGHPGLPCGVDFGRFNRVVREDPRASVLTVGTGAMASEHGEEVGSFEEGEGDEEEVRRMRRVPSAPPTYGGMK